MSKLVICEKPSVAKSIASALGVTSRADGYFEGGGWLISWCIGHLVGLADAAAYDDRYKKWRYEDLPILPDPFRYVVSEEKADQFHILRSLMERPDVTELVNACDAGREGELIFRLVYEAAGCSKPFSRLWISSMEDAAIREGFADLHPGADYDPLYQSALCRQKADWLIGINASRLFSVLYHRTLNIGRVQTPTLAMLADRDSKIVLFRKEKYHHVRLALEGAEAVSDRIVSQEDAQAIRDACARTGSWRLTDCTLYVTLEPCPMCAGAIINSRIHTLRYGTRDDKAGCCGSVLNLFEERFNHHPRIYQGPLKEECESQLQDFFRGLREKSGEI